MRKETGAMPPPGMEWEMGKTAGTIVFVGKAEAFLQNSPNKALENLVTLMKSGALVVTTELSVADILEDTNA